MQTFNSKRLNIHKEIPTTIPELLDAETRKACQERARENATFRHPDKRRKYLLGSLIFCRKCGAPRSGFTEIANEDNQYYRHSYQDKYSECDQRKFINKLEVEEAVLLHLIQMFGDPARIKIAVDRATLNSDQREDLVKEKEILNKELNDLQNERKRLVNAVQKDILKDDDIIKPVKQIEADMLRKSGRLDIIEATTKHFHDPVKIERLAKWSAKMTADLTRYPSHLLKMNYADKRKLLEHAFGGKDIEGNRLGVYVENLGTHDIPIWEIELRGRFGSTLLEYPVSDDYIEEVFGLDPQYCDVEKEVEKIRKDLTLNLKSIYKEYRFRS